MKSTNGDCNSSLAELGEEAVIGECYALLGEGPLFIVAVDETIVAVGQDVWVHYRSLDEEDDGFLGSMATFVKDFRKLNNIEKVLYG